MFSYLDILLDFLYWLTISQSMLEWMYLLSLAMSDLTLLAI